MDASVVISFTFVITQDIIRGIISSKNSKGNCGNKIEKSIHISEEEEQMLYYVAGFFFFFFSMKRKYAKILKENSKSISAPNALIFLEISKRCG